MPMTADSVTPSLTGPDVLASLLLYIIVYLMIYPAGLAVMLRFVWRGPMPTGEAAPVESGRPKSPIEALRPEALRSEALRARGPETAT